MSANGYRRPGISGLSRPYRIVAAFAFGVVAVATVCHLGLVFLHVAPNNTLSQRHGRAVDDWVYPEFEQNWKLFAPNPLQRNIAVHVRAQLRTESGRRSTTDWRNLSAEDVAAIRGNPFPSHVQQNELRRAWDFFRGSHNDDDRPVGERGELSEAYLRRLVMLRLARAGLAVRSVERVQLRSATTAVGPPAWSDEDGDPETHYRELGWWNITSADLPSGALRESTP
ncbi:DUF5819 family protein [Streptomyces sp. NPDC006879]|uniref:DUF5819 family protein n=1 Tax=Streptomyces sp. NPDC006879 TaxID=3364767 RepID=UPI0036B1B8FB